MPTTRFCDFVGGNDSNNGSSFALRKLTLASAASGLTGGDTVKVMASPAQTSLGQNATWTNGSDTVTLTTAVTANIDTCETAWTAATNITVLADTSNYREGTKGMTFTSNGSFTTGLIAYHTMSSTDFSAYQQVSFFIRTAFFNQLSSGQVALKLCSDTAGATPVNTISIAISGMTYSQWYNVVVDTAAALGATIQSVAVYAVSTWTSKSFTIDNVIACKASSAADSLTHNSYISKNDGTGTEAWFAIQSINGTTIKLWAQNAVIATPGTTYVGKYFGSTATVTTYKREPIILTALQTASANGSSFASLLTIEGGYNTTDMSTKTDRTYLRSLDPSIGCVNVGSTAFTNVKSFGFHTAGSGAYAFVHANAGATSDDICVNGGYYGALCSGGSGITFGFRYAVGCYEMLHFAGGWGSGYGPSKITCDFAWGLTSTNASAYIVNDSSNGGSVFNVTFDCADAQGWTVGIICGGSVSAATWVVRNTTFTNVYRDVSVNTDTYYYNVTPSTGSGALAVTLGNRNLFYTKLNGDSAQCGTVFQSYSGSCVVAMATDQRHTASDVSWKFALVGGVPVNYAPYLKIASVASVANEQRTVALWMRRDNTNLSMQLRVKGGFVAGITSDITSAMSAAINTWSQVTIQFTPTENCVVDVYAEAWNVSGNNNGWVDDLSVS